MQTGALLDKKVRFCEWILFDSFSFNIFDKLLHAQTCTHAAWNAAKQRFSTKIDFQICAAHTFSASAGLCLLHSTFLIPTPIHTLDFVHAHAFTQAPALPFVRLPHTRRVAGFADVCPDLLPAQALLMPVCWLWVFHSLLWNKSQRH